MNDALTAPAAPALRSFDLVNWHVEDSFTRVQVRGPHELTNQLLKVEGVLDQLTWDQAHALAQAAWQNSTCQEEGCVTVEPSWG